MALIDINGNPVSIAPSVDATTSANFVTNAFMLCDDAKFTVNGEEITIDISDRVLARVFNASYSNGSQKQSDFTNSFSAVMPLKNYDALIWDATNGIKKYSYAYGNISLPYNAVLLAYNYKGNIASGVFKQIWDRYYLWKPETLPERTEHITAEKVDLLQISSNSYHSIWHDEEYLYTMECYYVGSFAGVCRVYKLSDMSYVSDFTCKFKHTVNGQDSYPRWVSCDYDAKSDYLALGASGNGNYPEDMSVILFKNPRVWRTAGVDLDETNMDWIKVDMSGDTDLPADSTQCKVCWSGYDDTLIVVSNGTRHVYEVLLGKGTNNLGKGVYTEKDSESYNGTYKIVKKWEQHEPAYGPKQLAFHSGKLYYPIKKTDGGFYIKRTTLELNGNMKHDILVFDPLTKTGGHELGGSPEGCTFAGGYMYFGGTGNTIYRTKMF